MAEDKEPFVCDMSAADLQGGGPSATCLRGVPHDKFPLLDSVTQSATWTITEVTAE